MTTAELIQEAVAIHIQATQEHTVTPAGAQQIVEEVKAKVVEDRNLADVFRKNERPIVEWMRRQTDETHKTVQARFIPIPLIKITEAGAEEYVFEDFDLDFTEFTHEPSKNDLLIRIKNRQRK